AVVGARAGARRARRRAVHARAAAALALARLDLGTALGVLDAVALVLVRGRRQGPGDRDRADRSGADRPRLVGALVAVVVAGRRGRCGRGGGARPLGGGGAALRAALQPLHAFARGRGGPLAAGALGAGRRAGADPARQRCEPAHAQAQRLRL